VASVPPGVSATANRLADTPLAPWTRDAAAIASSPSADAGPTGHPRPAVTPPVATPTGPADPRSGAGGRAGDPDEAGVGGGADASGEPGGSARGRVRTTTKQRGRMSATKARALVELAPRYALGDAAASPLGTWLDRSFGRRAPRLLDVGTGTGEATVAWARAHPDQDVVAVELHRPGLARLLAGIDAAELDNVRVHEGDARDLLAGAGPGDLSAVRVLFPDPWPKRRHWPRRLVDGAFVARVADVLAPGGVLQVATDWAPYAEQVRAVLAAERRLGSPSAARPDRPVTAYEAAARAAGRPVVDLVTHRL